MTTRFRIRRGYLAAVALLVVAFNLRLVVTVVPPLLDDLGIGHLSASILAAAPTLMFGIGAFAGSWFRSHLGEERAVAALLLVLVIGMALRAVWTGWWGLLLGTLVSCAAVAVINVLLPSFVRRSFPGAISLITTAYVIVLSVGASVAAAGVVPLFEATGSLGIALGIWVIPVVIALLVWLTQVNEGRVVYSEAPVPGLWRDRLAWAVTLMFVFQGVVLFSLFSWLPSIYRDLGMSAVEAGYLLGIFNLAGICGTFVGPAVASRFRDERAGVTMAVTLTIIGIVGLLTAPQALPAVWVSLIGIGGGTAFPLALIIMVKRSRDGATAVKLSSMAQGVGYLAAAVATMAIGLLHDLVGSWEVPILLLLACCVGQLLAGRAAGRNGLVGTVIGREAVAAGQGA